jgi:hypothetical protein
MIPTKSKTFPRRRAITVLQGQTYIKGLVSMSEPLSLVISSHRLAFLFSQGLRSQYCTRVLLLSRSKHFPHRSWIQERLQQLSFPKFGGGPEGWFNVWNWARKLLPTLVRPSYCACCAGVLTLLSQFAF